MTPDLQDFFSNIKVVGTSHISKESVKKIDNALEDFDATIICVELDKKRLYALLEQKDEKPGLGAIKIYGLTGYLFILIGRYIQKKLGASIGMKPGTDMLHAINTAKKNNLKVGLIDQEIDITLRKLSKSFSWKEKFQLLKDLVTFRRVKVPFDISKIPKDELIYALLDEIKDKYPSLYNVLIDERNRFMAKKVFKIMKSNPEDKILCVLGAGHKKGFMEYLKSLHNSNP